MKKIRKCIGSPTEMPVAIVEIQAIAQRLPLPEFVAAAHHVEVEIAVTIGVEEDGIHVLVQAVGSKCRLRYSVKPAARVLHEQLAGLPLGAADVDVVPTIAVDVADRERWAFGRQQMRHQRLAAVIKEPVFFVFEGGRSGTDVREERLARGARVRVGASRGVYL